MRWLYLDIETVPLPDTPREQQERWGRVRNKRGNQRKSDTDLAPAVWEDWRKRALTVEYCQVVCIGWAVDDDDVATYAGPDEQDLLETLDGVVQGVTRDGPVTLVGHNVQGYDLPILRARAMREGRYDLAETLGAWESHRPWRRTRLQCYDTMQRWPQMRGKWPSLDRICGFLGVPHYGWGGEGDHGVQVLSHHRVGDYDAIATDCRHDVAAVRDIHRRMTGL